ncbi:hypothetical protein JIG36_40260 [Actinoplanes sp. LDG1-06]|uniref:histidine kinase n=1 Tax=Paractinoplanes ovalisporus TaxID=2810368 RepID=A0ABS2ARC4_9ACTN|nr:histidine kinase [Actinoplanes ovalisporus]MBM2621756.1 hypothetical protein [Actinoplanes ovalisporus]
MRGRREWWADGLLGAVLIAPVATHQVMSGSVPGILAALAAAAVMVLTARRWPVVGWLVVVAGTLVDGNFVFALPVVSYLVGLRTEKLGAVAAAFGAIAVGGTVLNFAVFGTGQAEWFFLAMAWLVLGVFPWLAGRYRAQHARLVSAGWERAARLEYERRMVEREARLRERARIAQEMHDSLGHELSLIALSAGALETTPAVPEKQRAAAGRIRESAATATDQLREIIGVLREEGEEAPTTQDDIGTLVARSRDAGLPITLETGGDLPRKVRETAFQVVREGLTNASRHAPGAAVTVTLRDDGDRSHIAVVNGAADEAVANSRAGGAVTNGPTGGGVANSRAGGAVTNGPTDGGVANSRADGAVVNKAVDGAEATGRTGGLGIVGLRERVRINGGKLTAEPTPDGGFRLVAEIPRGAAPAPVTGETEMRRRTRRSLAAAVLTPAVLVAVTALGYYPFAVAGSVLEEAAFERLTAGTPRADLTLPRRQAPGDKPEGCELYTDGNFPMADAAYRLCFTDGRLSSKERLH